MTPAVKRAIEALRRAKAKLQFSDMLSAAQAFDLVSEALAGLEAAAALRRPAAAEVEEMAKWLEGRELTGQTGSFTDAAAMLRRLSPSPTGEEWRPIETAPKDGTKILAWSDAFVWREPSIAYWGRSEPSQRSAWLGGHCRTDHIDQPTHWRPLPAPPSLPTDKT